MENRGFQEKVGPAPLLNEKAVAHFLDVTIRALQRWRSVGEGPPYVKIGRCVRYRPEDLEVFITSNLKAPFEE